MITGAGGGIGRASALRFASLGARVVINDINAETLTETGDLILAAGGEAAVVQGDVADPATADQLVDSALEHYGQLNVMFCNAGGSFPTPMLDIDSDEYRRLMGLNLDGVYFCALAALRTMVPHGGGCILATTSGAGTGAVPGLAVYGAAKAGVNSLVRSIAAEYGREGIRAVCLSPGAMDTPGLRQWLSTLPGGAEAYEAAQPTGRLGKPEEIADVAVFLASDMASFINGSEIPVDGAVQALLAMPS